MAILVIDDEAAFLRSLELVLEDLHEVVVCSRSPDALTLLRADPKRFGAVLCDLSMRDLDGVAFYRHMDALVVADRFIPHDGRSIHVARGGLSPPFALPTGQQALHPRRAPYCPGRACAHALTS